MKYYTEKEFLEANAEYEKAEAKAEIIKGEVLSFRLGKLPFRTMTEEDIAIMQDAHNKWAKVLEIARRPLNTRAVI